MIKCRFCRRSCIIVQLINRCRHRPTSRRLVSAAMSDVWQLAPTSLRPDSAIRRLRRRSIVPKAIRGKNAQPGEEICSDCARICHVRVEDVITSSIIFLIEVVRSKDTNAPKRDTRRQYIQQARAWKLIVIACLSRTITRGSIPASQTDRPDSMFPSHLSGLLRYNKPSACGLEYP